MKDRGEKIRHVVELALRRHLDNPPPPPRPVDVPPLPPVTSPGVVEPVKDVKPVKKPKK